MNASGKKGQHKAALSVFGVEGLRAEQSAANAKDTELLSDHMIDALMTEYGQKGSQMSSTKYMMK